MDGFSKISRRGLLKTSAVGLSFLFLPGKGRVRADHLLDVNRDEYYGRLCYNENPLGPSPRAMAAMQPEISRSNRYPDWYSDGLERQIGEVHGLPKNAICVGAGATEILRLIGDAFLHDGDEMVTANPTYFQMATEAVQNGATVVYVPVDGDYRIDLNTMYQAITRKTRLISLVNPNNPQGTCIHPLHLEDFLYSLPEKIMVLVDEAYHHYVQIHGYESCIRYVHEGLPVIVVRTFSKAFGLAGARIGYAAGLQKYISRLNANQLYGTVSNISQAAAGKALDDVDHVDETVRLNRQSMRILRKGLTRLGVQYIPSETNFMMFETSLSAPTLGTALAARGFQVRWGWGMPNHIRISTGYPDEMEAFITALEECLSLLL